MDDTSDDDLFSNYSDFDYLTEEPESDPDQEVADYRIQLLSIYAFLRTLSLELQLSPFDSEQFLYSIDFSPKGDTFLNCTYNTLINEIHYRLILVCLSLAEHIDQQPWWEVSWNLLNRETWPQFIQPLFQIWQADESMGSLCIDISSIINSYDRREICYNNYPQSLKFKILHGMISIILSTDIMSDIMEQRENRPLNVDPFPQFKKGDDGYPDVCILCVEGGDLLCCEYCPASYHRHCVYEKNTSVFDGEWQCYECSCPDPMRGRGRLPWHLCREGYLSIIGSSLIYKPYAKSSIYDYIELKYSDLHKLIPESAFQLAHWKHFLFYIGSLLQKGLLYISNESLSDDDDDDYATLNDYDEDSSLGNDDVAFNPEFESYFNDDDNSSVLSDASNDKKKRRVSRRSKSRASSNVNATKAGNNRLSSSSKNKEYVRIDHLLDAIKSYRLSFDDVRKVKEVGPNIINYDVYVNHYRDAKNSPVFRDLQSQLIVSKCNSKSFKSYMECLYHAIGPLNHNKLWLSLSLSSSSWIVSLHLANTLKECCKLLYKLINTADKKIFRPEWFASPLESEYANVGRLKKLKISDDSGSKYRRTSKKSNILRFHYFLSVKKQSQASKSNSLSSKSHHIKKVTPSHITSPTKQLNSDHIDNGFDDDITDKANPIEHDILSEDSDEYAPNFHDVEHTQFSQGKRLLSRSQRCHVPRKHLRRLGRLGGLGFLPSITYDMQPNMYASAPFYWYWNYRVLHCNSLDSLVLQMRFVEECLVERVQKRICPAYVNDLLSNEYADCLIESSSIGFIMKEKKKRKVDVITPFANVCNALARSTYHIAMNSSVDYIPLVDQANFQHHPIPHMEYQVISGDPDLNMTFVTHFEADPSLIASYNLRQWISSLLDSQSNIAEYQRLQTFCNTIYDLILLSGYSEDDEMMLYKEVHTAITLERGLALREIVNMLLPSAKDIQFDQKMLMVLVDNILNKAIIAVTELVKYDFVATVTQKPTETVRKSLRGRTDEQIITSPTIEVVESEVNNSYKKMIVDSVVTTTSKRPDSGPFRALYDRFSDKDVLRKKKSFVPIHETNLIKQRVMTKKEAEFVDPSFCVTTLPSTSYLPQVGDEVIYYIAGHRDYSKIYLDNNRVERKGLIKKQLDNEYGICCRVLTIDYEFPAAPTHGDRGIQLVLQLGVCAGQQHVPAKTFIVLYRPGHSSAEFLVLRVNMEATLSKLWCDEMAFSMLYEGGQRYIGKILTIERDPVGLSIWAGVKVFWDSWGEDRVNEWELEGIEELPVPVLKIPKNRRGVAKFVEEVEVPINAQYIDDVVSQKKRKDNDIILDIISKYMKNPEFEAFRDFVTEDVAPDYYCYVPFCVCLNFIEDRAKSSYYRQPHGFLGDIRTLYLNCSYYNLEQSPLTLAAANLYRSILREVTARFPNLSFHDYIVFDRCLGNKSSVVSLMHGGLHILQ